ncbi:hypothetical protein STEG23_010942, partial [Scotinomys teguina]
MEDLDSKTCGDETERDQVHAGILVLLVHPVPYPLTSKVASGEAAVSSGRIYPGASCGEFSSVNTVDDNVVMTKDIGVTVAFTPRRPG